MPKHDTPDTGSIRRALDNGHYGTGEAADDIRALLDYVAELEERLDDQEDDDDEPRLSSRESAGLLAEQMAAAQSLKRGGR